MSLTQWVSARSGIVISIVTAFTGGVIATVTISKMLYATSRRPTASVQMELLAMGIFAMTYRIQDLVLKTARVDDEPEETQASVKAMRNEANVYLILGKDDLIAEYLYISPTKDLVILKYYPHGNLKDHISNNPRTKQVEMRRWARQMIEGVSKLHRSGVRHSDIRLDQWLLDESLNARLSDFNASGFDENASLDLQGSRPLGVEGASHFKPRDPLADNTVISDLFALGSALYELEVGDVPLAGVDEEKIEELFEAGHFPKVDALRFGTIILGCWKGQFESAQDLLYTGEKSSGL